jgi:hypothetical protein
MSPHYLELHQELQKQPNRTNKFCIKPLLHFGLHWVLYFSSKSLYVSSLGTTIIYPTSGQTELYLKCIVSKTISNLSAQHWIPYVSSARIQLRLCHHPGSPGTHYHLVSGLAAVQDDGGTN